MLNSKKQDLSKRTKSAEDEEELQVEGQSSRLPTVKLNHSYWCAMLTVMCLRSKTAAYLQRSFQCRLPPGKLPTVFPIPVPDFDPWSLLFEEARCSPKEGLPLHFDGP